MSDQGPTPPLDDVTAWIRRDSDGNAHPVSKPQLVKSPVTDLDVQDHIRRAERLLALVVDDRGVPQSPDDWKQLVVQVAQVHATLAHAKYVTL